MIIYLKEQTVAVENAAMEAGISQQRLMENAGSTVAKVIRDKYGCQSVKISVICGKGNNGGDGYVAARRLAKDGADVTLITFDGLPAGQAAHEMYLFAAELGLPIIDANENMERCLSTVVNSDVILDAAYGFGFHGEMPAVLSRIFDTVANSAGAKVAIDVPSGVECDSGLVSKHTAHADVTVTFISRKPCHVLYPSAAYCGEVVLADIGIPQSCYLRSGIGVIGDDYVKGILPVRPNDGHKGTFGTVYTVCGSYGMCGAAAIAAKAAMRSGVGLVKMAVSEPMYSVLGVKLDEPVFDICTDSPCLTADCAVQICTCVAKADSVLFGCGSGNTDDTQKLLQSVISAAHCPVVIDADGINSLSRNIDIVRSADCEIVLTPHIGEMARLCGVTVDELMSNRIGYGEYIAMTYGITVVMKDANTLVFLPNGCVYVNTAGNSGMATAGSGDMLAGIIASLLAQGVSAADAARAGVYIHAVCGDITAEELGKRSMTVSDMLENLHKAFLKFEE